LERREDEGEGEEGSRMMMIMMNEGGLMLGGMEYVRLG